MSNNSYTAKGSIIAIDEIQTFSSGFQKREFVIEIPDGKYPQSIKFEVLKDNVERLSPFVVGDEITVTFDLRGREYNGKYFTNLVAWKIEGRASGGRREPHPVSKQQEAPQSEEDEDDIPF